MGACESAARDQRHAPVASLGYTPRDAAAPSSTRSYANIWKASSRRRRAPIRSDCHRFSSGSSGLPRLRGVGPRLRTVSMHRLSRRNARPFSCKRRGFCPSCGGRRMAAGAAELVDHILPHVPIRQWVLSLPHALRYRLAWDHALCRAVLAIYTRALLGFERRRGRRRGRALPPAGERSGPSVERAVGRDEGALTAGPSHGVRLVAEHEDRLERLVTGNHRIDPVLARHLDELSAAPASCCRPRSAAG